MRPKSPSTARTTSLHALLLADVGRVAARRAARVRDLARDRFELSGLRPTSATRAPSAASSCAVQRPMPLPAPVTMPAWPANRPSRKTD